MIARFGNVLRDLMLYKKNNKKHQALTSTVFRFYVIRHTICFPCFSDFFINVFSAIRFEISVYFSLRIGILYVTIQM